MSDRKEAGNEAVEHTHATKRSAAGLSDSANCPHVEEEMCVDTEE